MQVGQKKGTRSPFSYLLISLYAICLLAILTLLGLLIHKGADCPDEPAVPSDTLPTDTFPSTPTVSKTVPDWYRPGTLSTEFSLTIPSETRELISTCHLNIPLPSFATYAWPANGRYLQLISENNGGYSYFPAALSGSKTILMDMTDGSVFGLEQTITAVSPLQIPDTVTPSSCVDILELGASEQFCLFRYHNYQYPLKTDENGQIFPLSAVGIYCFFDKTVRLLPTLNELDFTAVCASGDYAFFVLCIEGEKEKKTVLFSTADMTLQEISRYEKTDYTSVSCTFSPTERYLVNHLNKDEDPPVDIILTDLKTGRQTGICGTLHHFCENDAALLVTEGKKTRLYSLPDGKEIPTDEIPATEKYYLQVSDGCARLIFWENGSDFLLFDNIQTYAFWQDCLFLKRKNEQRIICYARQKHQAFETDISDFLQAVGTHEEKRFDFSLVCGGKNLFLRVSYPEEDSLYPDLDTRFIDETYQLMPVIEAVGMKAFRAYEEGVYQKYSTSRRNARPPLWDFVTGLNIPREKLEAVSDGTYETATLDLIYTPDESTVLDGLKSPYTLYANGKVLLYTDVLKMSEKQLTEADLPLSVYQKYFAVIHTVFVRHDSPESTADFEEKCAEFEKTYANAFP